MFVQIARHLSTGKTQQPREGMSNSKYKLGTWLVNRDHRHTRLKNWGKGSKQFCPSHDFGFARFHQEAQT